MINYNPMFIFVGLITAPASVTGCFVHPTSVVVTIGERVILTCATHGSGSITSWHMPIDNWQTITVYTAPIYYPDGVIEPSTLAQGYFVTRPAYNETTLQMNDTVLSQAGLYVCTCGLRSKAVARVIVLDSEPKFTTDYSGAYYYGEPVTFSCSVSFNASSDVSCDSRIEDASGSTVARGKESTVDNGLISCNLKHTIIANASSDQLMYTCNVTLRNKEEQGIIYSRVLKAFIEWQPISSTADVLSTKGMRAETVIIIAVVVCFIIRSKKRDTMLIRQRSMGQPAEQSSRCQQKPTNQYDKKRIGNSISATSCHDDGYFAEGIYQEI